MTGLVEITFGPILFDPVPRLRRRRNGWTDEAQRAFIAALERCGCVTRAARAVGMARGVDRLRLEALDRPLNGAWVPVVRRGRLVRTEHRHNDRLAIALLSGRTPSVADDRERAVSRRRYRMEMATRDKSRAEAKRQAEAVWAEHQAILDRIEQERSNPLPRSVTAPPLIRSL